MSNVYEVRAHGSRVELTAQINFLGHTYFPGAVAEVKTSSSDGTLELKMSDGRTAFAHDDQVMDA